MCKERLQLGMYAVMIQAYLLAGCSKPIKQLLQFGLIHILY